MLAFSLALLAAVSLQQGPNATVRGQVRSEGSGAPLRLATVQVVTANRVIQATTDTLGMYVLRNVPSGRRVLRATHFDHAPLEIEVIVKGSNQVMLDFGLELRPVKLPALTARAPIFKGIGDTVPAGEAALGQAEVKALEATPGVAELGLAEATQDVPGQPSDPTDVLYVRGGTADLKLVLLNGAPVYAPFHLGGLINALDADFMRAAKLYVGGAPARYDGGLSYVLDLETRAGRDGENHGSLAVDLLGSRTLMEGPITKGSSYLVGARSVHGMGAEAFLDDEFPYSYTDGLARIDFGMFGGQVTVTGFWNQEKVRLDSLAGGNARANWGNTAGSVRYRSRVLGADADFTIAAGNFHTQLPVGGVRPIITDGNAERVRASAHFARSIGSVALQYGASAEQQEFVFRAWPRSAGRDSLLLHSDAAGDVSGAYIDAQWQVIPRLTIRSGVRADVFSISKRTRFAPRMSATLLLSDHATLTVAGGRYRQYVRSESSGIIGTPIADSVSAAPLAIAQASHFVVALDQELGVGLRLGLEGYYKAFEDLPSSQGELAEASGVELWVRRATGRYTGWLGYSLAWIWTVDGPQQPISVFAGRQLLSAGASGPLLGNGKFDVRLSYGAGLPFTAIPEPEASTPVFGLRPGGSPHFSAIPTTSPDDGQTDPVPPDEQYLRVDAQVAHTFMTEVRGFEFEFTPYFKVLNALGRRDALFYHFDRSQQDTQARAVAALPVLPILGLEWRF
ncbi:MAG TPA: carboxypeptidase regulatory-like domain-containing protein [Longimicrobiales bacterium]|nr:carboxypeptidase regulatory-like domain-containing protein [Longimicrobiales bacterium]